MDEHGFKEWIFSPGMLFNASDKWWGDQGKRDKPHEGLDLCLYKDRRGRMRRLDEKTKIPVIYDGIVVGIVNDFLGKSVIIEHGLTDSDNNRFCTIYGHLNPHKGLHVGRIVKEGDIIPGNAHFDTTKGHIEFREATAIDCTIDEAFDTTIQHPFKGNIDLNKLEDVLKKNPKEQSKFSMLLLELPAL